MKKEEDNVVENTTVKEEVDKGDAKIAELTNDLQRLRADFENYRKQTEAQKTQAMNITKAATVIKFLPLLDDIDRAMAAYPEQLAPLQKSLEKTLSGLMLKKIDSSVGVEFDPELHDAVMTEDGEGEKDVITEVLRDGYYYGDEVVRPAMVKVGKA